MGLFKKSIKRNELGPNLARAADEAVDFMIRICIRDGINMSTENQIEIRAYQYFIEYYLIRKSNMSIDYEQILLSEFIRHWARSLNATSGMNENIGFIKERCESYMARVGDASMDSAEDALVFGDCLIETLGEDPAEHFALRMSLGPAMLEYMIGRFDLLYKNFDKKNKIVN